MPFPELMPASQFNVLTAASTQKGQIVIPYRSVKAGPVLRVDHEERKLAIRLSESDQDAFRVVNIASEHRPMIALKDWSVRVDPTSAFSGFDDTPKAGDLFITGDNTIGLIGLFGHDEVWVSLDGTFVDEPAWAKEAVLAFTRFAFGVQVDGEFREIARRG